MKKIVLIFSLLILALILLFQIGKYTILSGNLKLEIFVAIVAIIFFFVGIYLNKKSLHKKQTLSYQIDSRKIEKLEISKREYEVLQLISKGYSNKEIAEQLFLTESTIKTHVSNLLVKLNAKRRTQAIEIAKALKII